MKGIKLNMKKGFVFIETVITVVVLAASLLYLYSSYNDIIVKEERRLYYDDVAHIYKANYVRNFLEEYSNIEEIKNYAFNRSYVINIGPDFDSMFTDINVTNNMRATFNTLFSGFNMNQIILVSSDLLKNCRDSEDSKCDTSNLSYSLNSYINTLNSTNYDTYLVIEFSEINTDGKITRCTPGDNTYCDTYYVSLEI